VLTNVLGNAVKFTEKGEVRLLVKSSPLAGGKVRLAFAVEDTGVGMSASAQERLFQDFAQADATMTRRFGGTGLGLSLSRRLVRLLGGDLVLDHSDVGKGSRFSFWLDVEVIAEKTRRYPLPAPINQQSLAGMMVLLVDDAPDNQFLVSHMLRNAGASVDLASDGSEGIERALHGHYDIVLMDLQMPRLDGYEATTILRSRGYTRPIIALTAHAMKEERDRCISKGFTDHLAKPIKQRELLAQIQRHASGKAGATAAPHGPAHQPPAGKPGPRAPQGAQHPGPIRVTASVLEPPDLPETP
jgi:CheY-like chemotaxis protein